jgi:hypothetical protein
MAKIRKHLNELKISEEEKNQNVGKKARDFIRTWE